jgi:hypothetical protein
VNLHGEQNPFVLASPHRDRRALHSLLLGRPRFAGCAEAETPKS